MSLFDDVLKRAGGASDLMALAAQHPQIVAAAASLLSHRSDSVGGSGGLGGLIGAFERGGLGDVMSSWLSTGANKPVDPGQLAAVLGPDTLSQFARQAGIDHSEAASVLASILPHVVDHVSRDGAAPPAASLEGMLGSFFAR